MLRFKTYPAVQEDRPIVLLPNILGESVAAIGPRESTHAYRARRMAALLNVTVVAFDRPTDQSVGAHARVARQLADVVTAYGSDTVVLAGASAAGLTTLRIARTELLPVAGISVFDPAAQTNQSGWQLGRNWLRHQTKVEPRKPLAAANHHPMEPQFPWSQLAVVKGTGLLLKNVRASMGSWKTDESIGHLAHIAGSPGFTDVAVQAAFVGHSFLSEADQADSAATMLNAIRPVTAPAEFNAQFYPDLYHSWTDDPFRLAGFVSCGLKQLA